MAVKNFYSIFRTLTLALKQYKDKSFVLAISWPILFVLATAWPILSILWL